MRDRIGRVYPDVAWLWAEQIQRQRGHVSAIRSQPRQSAHFDAAQSTIPLIYDTLFILSSRPRTEEGQMGQERPILSKPCPLSVSFHKRQIAALRVELRRARLESPEAVAEILVALDQELEALAQARMAAEGALDPAPWPQSW